MKKKIKRLWAELDKVEEALDAARLDSDCGLVETQKTIAGLTANYWMLRRRIASVVAQDATLSGQERGRAMNDEIDFDRRHNEAQAQFARLADKQKVDLLPKVLAKLEEISTDEQELQDFAGAHA